MNGEAKGAANRPAGEGSDPGGAGSGRRPRRRGGRRAVRGRPPAVSHRPRRPRRWPRSRRSPACIDPVVDHLGPALRACSRPRPGPRPSRQRRPVSSHTSRRRGGLQVGVAGFGLALGQRPVVVAGTVDRRAPRSSAVLPRVATPRPPAAHGRQPPSSAPLTASAHRPLAARAGCRRHGVSQAFSFLRSAFSQASRHWRRCFAARSCSARTSRPATKASGAVASDAIESRSHACGHDGVLVVAEHALQAGDGLGVARRRPG